MSSPVSMLDEGQAVHDLARRLFPIARSLTGDGVRQTLKELQSLLPTLQIREVPSGTKAFDWEVPQEWNVRDAYVLDPAGNKIIDFQRNNLHLMGYSEPVDGHFDLRELDAHLYSLPDQPSAIPYATSYYERKWGFCLTHEQRSQLKDGLYRVRIDGTLQPGFLTYGELVLPGDEPGEVLVSTYLCHPSLANDNLSGVCVTAHVAAWLQRLPRRRYTYRILFIPETIGSIVYLSQHLDHLKRHTVAGFVVTCVGDERTYSFIPSRLGETLADRVALLVLQQEAAGFHQYTFLDRGSDERQYCSPGVDLPVVSITRSKYREFPEYHTSLDDLALITPHGLGGSLAVLKQCLLALERNRVYRATNLCEPRLGRRNLFPDTSIKGSVTNRLNTLNVLAYCDGRRDVLDLARRTGVRLESCWEILDELLAHGLVELFEARPTP